MKNKKKKIVTLFFIFITIILILSYLGYSQKKKEQEKYNTINLSEKYYNEGKFIPTSANELEEKNSETYILYTYNNFCSLPIPCESIFKTIMEKYKIDILSIPINEFKKTKFYTKVKYGPSIIIIKNEEIITYLDANKDEDLEKYQDVNAFDNWLKLYINLKK
ncbi:MAG: hypothetical protein PUD34_00925 [bacterium]|nr:hypothetical protein [bacterium]